MIITVKEAFPSKWLSSTDVPEGGEITGIIAANCLVKEKFKKPGTDKEEEKWVLYFRDQKPMILNRGNLEMLILLFGEDTALWTGQQIIIGTEWVTAFGKTTRGLRIRPETTEDRKAQTVSAPAPPVSSASVIFDGKTFATMDDAIAYAKAQPAPAQQNGGQQEETPQEKAPPRKTRSKPQPQTTTPARFVDDVDPNASVAADTITDKDVPF